MLKCEEVADIHLANRKSLVQQATELRPRYCVHHESGDSSRLDACDFN